MEPQGNIGPDTLVIIGAAAAVLITLMLAFLWAMRPKRTLSQRQYDAELLKRRIALDDLGLPMVHDVRIPDRKGGAMKVDHVVKLPASVVMVTSAPANMAGPTRVSPHMGTWRYIDDKGRVAGFRNPVVALHPLIHAIRQRFPMVKLRLLTVFPRTAELGSQPPRGCCKSDQFMQTLKDMAKTDGAASANLDKSWNELSTILKQASGRGDPRAKGAGKATAGARPARAGGRQGYAVRRPGSGRFG